jgi:hypothetical protein
LLEAILCQDNLVSVEKLLIVLFVDTTAVSDASLIVRAINEVTILLILRIVH